MVLNLDFFQSHLGFFQFPLLVVKLDLKPEIMLAIPVYWIVRHELIHSTCNLRKQVLLSDCSLEVHAVLSLLHLALLTLLQDAVDGDQLPLQNGRL